ncbi:hypothetical protein AAC387_Pa04g0791 [Persea americana]
MLSLPMIGGHVTLSTNSPLLRRSSSRAADLGANEMKTGSSTIPIMPSPIFLWRFKVLLFIVWGFSCCKISWDSVMRMSADLRDLFLYEAFLYYNPLLLMTMMVWLWGVNLWVFAQSSVNCAKIFDLDNNHLTHRETWKCATWMTIVAPTSMTAYLYLYSHGEVSLAASQPVLLYAVVLIVLVSPFDIFYLSSRYYLLRTLWRIILPLQAISFSDFFLADILTSMAKVFSDLERSVCRMVHRQVATIAWFEADSVCALKYSTAVPVIFLSALKYHVIPDRWTNMYRLLWLLSSVINSLYSFYWDVTRDWDLSVFSRIFKFKNPHLCSNILYGRQWVYYWAIGSNLILRCTWTYKLSAHLRHNYLTVFTITALEMLRRFQWIFFRVENEWNKMALKPSLQVSMSDVPKEDDNLLGSDNHVV